MTSSSLSRAAAAAPMVTAGVLSVVAGGLLAAATASVTTRELAWLTAYLVLVAGVAAVALGLGQAYLSAAAPSVRLVYAELVVFYLANALVVVGTLADRQALTDLGGVLLVIALAGFVYGARGATGSRPWRLHAYRAVVLILLVSIPIGLVLGRTSG